MKISFKKILPFLNFVLLIVLFVLSVYFIVSTFSFKRNLEPVFDEKMMTDALLAEQPPAGYNEEKPEKMIFNIAFETTPMETVNVIQRETAIWNTVFENTRFEPHIVCCSSYEEVGMKIKFGEVDLGKFGASSYLENVEKAELDILFIRDARDEPKTTIFLVNATSGIFAPEDFKGKSIAFKNKGSTSGYYVPLHCVEEHGITLADFSRIEFVNNEVNSVEGLIRNDYDIIVLSSTYVNKIKPDVMANLRKVAESDPIPRGCFAVSQKMPAYLKKELIGVLMQFNIKMEDDDLRKELWDKGLDWFAKIPDEKDLKIYSKIQQLMKEYQ